MNNRSQKISLTSKQRNELEQITDLVKLRGVGWVLKYTFLSCLSYLAGPIWELYYRNKYSEVIKPEDRFLFKSQKYKYFKHKYNFTWKNERTIEIPLARACLKLFGGKNILEIGNVLSHYSKVDHDILDNYEIAQGVINEDVMRFKSDKKYDTIISVSTFEHVGVDGLKDKKKAIQAISKLLNHLKTGGRLIFTIPVNYNPALDAALFAGKIKLAEIHYFKRVSVNNKWIEVGKEDVINAKYSFPFRWGNAVLLGIIKK